MKVKELIKDLKTQPQDAKVFREFDEEGLITEIDSIKYFKFGINEQVILQ